MAFGMKHWIGLVVAGILLVMALAIPSPDSWFWATPRERNTVNPEGERAAELRSDLQGLVLRVQRVRWKDSLESLMRDAAARGEVVVTGYPTGLHGDLEERQRERADSLAELAAQDVRDDVAAIPDRRDDALLGVFWIDQLAAVPESGPEPPLLGGTEYYAGTLDGRPYCLTLTLVDERSVRMGRAYEKDFRRPAGSWLGPCYYWARYGSPGEEVRAWLERGAFGFAQLRKPSPEWALPTDLGVRAFGPVFWSMAWRFDRGRYHLKGCVAGRERHCRDLFLQTAMRSARVRPAWAMEDSRAGDAIGLLGTGFYYYAAPYNLTLFADLEREFGPERFERFWSSAAEPVEAFRTAFGTDPGAWLTEWARGRYPAAAAGPGLRGRTFLHFLLAVALCMGAAVGIARKREVA